MDYDFREYGPGKYLGKISSLVAPVLGNNFRWDDKVWKIRNMHAEHLVGGINQGVLLVEEIKEPEAQP